jgi:hypothetical protein
LWDAARTSKNKSPPIFRAGKLAAGDVQCRARYPRSHFCAIPRRLVEPSAVPASYAGLANGGVLQVNGVLDRVVNGVGNRGHRIVLDELHLGIPLPAGGIQRGGNLAKSVPRQ